MPIRPEHYYFYPIDWLQLSAVIRFRRAGGCCEGCARPHGQRGSAGHISGDGRWWDPSTGTCRDGQGRCLTRLPTIEDLSLIRTTKVVLAAAHCDHNNPTASSSPAAGTQATGSPQRFFLTYC